MDRRRRASIEFRGRPVPRVLNLADGGHRDGFVAQAALAGVGVDAIRETKALERELPVKTPRSRTLVGRPTQALDPLERYSRAMEIHDCAVATLTEVMRLAFQGSEVSRMLLEDSGGWPGAGDSTPESFLPFVLLAAAAAVIVRLVVGGFDGDRVEAYVRQRGWELVDRSWDPFGPGWFGEKDSRIYQIVYRDERGDLHRAHVKTSMFSGVYLTNDEVVESGAPDAPATGAGDLEAENARLRKRVAELEAGEH